MPNFGSSQQVSGRAGSFCKLGGGQRMNMFCVGYGGIGNRRNDGNTVSVNGVGPTAPGLGKRTGPKEAPAFQPMFGSYKQQFQGGFSISGNTVDGTGAALASCRVELQEVSSDRDMGETVSDGSGAFTFTVPYNSWYYRLLAYKVGSPDVAGVSVDTLTATWNGN